MRAAPTILSAAVAGLLLACSDSTEPSSTTPDFQGPAEPAFQVTPATATLQPGQTLQLGTRYSGNSAFLGVVSVGWHSSNESVATVSPGGLVRALGDGQVTIVAVWGVYRASARVAVAGPMKKHETPPVCQQAVMRPGHGKEVGC